MTFWWIEDGPHLPLGCGLKNFNIVLGKVRLVKSGFNGKGVPKHPLSKLETPWWSQDDCEMWQKDNQEATHCMKSMNRPSVNAQLSEITDFYFPSLCENCWEHSIWSTVREIAGCCCHHLIHCRSFSRMLRISQSWSENAGLENAVKGGGGHNFQLHVQVARAM